MSHPLDPHWQPSPPALHSPLSLTPRQSLDSPSSSSRSSFAIQQSSSIIRQSSSTIHHSSSIIHSPITSFYNDDGNVDIDSTDIYGRSSLHHAAFLNNVQEVHRLLSLGATANIMDNRGCTSLHVAAEYGYDQVVDVLLNKGHSNVFLSDYNNCSALHQACCFGHSAVVKLLLQHCLHQSSPSVIGVSGSACVSCDMPCAVLLQDINDGYTPLHRAALNGHVAICRLLLDHYKVHRSLQLLPDSIETLHLGSVDSERSSNTNNLVFLTGDKGITALHLAAQCGRYDVMTCLVNEYDAAIDAPDHAGETALHKACFIGDRQGVEVLLNLGADVTKVTHDGLSCLHYVTGCHGPSSSLQQDSSRASICNLLVTHGHPPTSLDNDGDTALHRAARFGRLGVILELVRLTMTEDQPGGNVGVSSDKGGVSEDQVKSSLLNCQGCNLQQLTPLHIACLKGYTAAAQLLMDLGCNLDLITVKGWTAVHCATLAMSSDILKDIIQRINHPPTIAAMINQRDIHGSTCLHLLCRFSKPCVTLVATLTTLLEAGASLTERDTVGLSPVHVAAMTGNDVILTHLLHLYHHPESPPSFPIPCFLMLRDGWKGRLPLHWAVFHTHLPVISLLLSSPSIAAATATHPSPMILLTDNHGQTCLHLLMSLPVTCSLSILPILQLLLQFVDTGCLQLMDDEGHSPLHLAALQGHSEAVILMFKWYHEKSFMNNISLSTHHISKIPFINCVDYDGYTALHLAAYHLHPSIVMALLNEGADDRVTTPMGLTPFQMAHLRGGGVDDNNTNGSNDDDDDRLTSDEVSRRRAVLAALAGEAVIQVTEDVIIRDREVADAWNWNVDNDNIGMNDKKLKKNHFMPGLRGGITRGIGPQPSAPSVTSSQSAQRRLGNDNESTIVSSASAVLELRNGSYAAPLL